MQCISRGRPQEPELCIVNLIAIIPLIDRASNDDSNGGHIVIWSYFDLGIEIPAVRSILTLPAAFLTSF